MIFRIVGGIVLLAAVIFFTESFHERHTLKTTHYEIKTDKIPKGETVKIVFLSDLHNATFGKNNEILISKILDEHPEAVIFGGDMVGSDSEKISKMDSLESLLSGLSGRCGIYYAKGNHEENLVDVPTSNCPVGKKEWEELVSRYPLTVLGKEAAKLKQNIYLCNLTLPDSVYRAHKKVYLRGGYLEENLGEPKGFQILTVHSPLYFREAKTWGANLVLSGHFHGGTIYLGKKLGGLMTPQFQFFEKKVCGIWGEKSKLIISRGIGTHSVNIRFNDYPEITAITLSGE